MEKVLITGATSSQSSGDAHKRSARFAGLVNSAFNFCGYQSVMKSVSVAHKTQDLDEYSLVIVGMAPFTSMSANKIYPALNTLSLAAEQNKAVVLLDAPEPHLVFQSFKSVLANPDIFLKELYAGREGYVNVHSDKKLQKRLLSTIDFVVSGDYEVVVPSLPYFNGSRDIYGIPGTKTLHQLNFDGLFVDRKFDVLNKESKFWLAESASNRWARDIAKTLSKPTLNVRRTQYDTESDYISRMQKAYGYLLNTYKNSTPWWSANIVLALSCGVPVFSDWRHTGSLGMSWSGLPYTVENMSREERYELAVLQSHSYFSSVPEWSDSAKSATSKLLMQLKG